MPTDDERREIAKRLRDLKQLGRYSTACLDSCVAQHSADLVRRAKALAERERGE